MSSIWTKIAAAAVVAVVVIVVLGRFGGDESAPAPAEKDKTFYDMAERDRQFNEEPEPVAEVPAEPVQQPVVEPQAQPEPPAQQAPAQPPVAQAPDVMLPSSITRTRTLYFTPMSEEDDIAAQQLLPYATAGRSIGRLPGPQYGLMMRAIEQIEQRWPDSWYNFRAKQMMEEITQYSDRYAMMYKITPQRLDISKFLKPRPGTKPREVDPVR